MHRKNPENDKLKQTTTVLFSHLKLRDKLTWRGLNRATRDEVKEASKGPYVIKAQFVMAVSCHFRNSKLDSRDYLESAWRVYNRTLNSNSKRPAILYKLREKGAAVMHAELSGDNEDECPFTTQRIYGPTIHTWPVNQVWCLAQIHMGRKFVIFSSTTDENLFHKNHSYQNPRGYSAFAREIAVAVHAGYLVRLNTTDHTVELVPPTNCKLTHVKLHDLNLSERDIFKATTFVHTVRTVYASNPPKKLIKPPFAGKAKPLNSDNNIENPEEAMQLRLAIGRS